jgi:hypothetical protein
MTTPTVYPPRIGPKPVGRPRNKPTVTALHASSEPTSKDPLFLAECLSCGHTWTTRKERPPTCSVCRRRYDLVTRPLAA